jgi:hypothetical protein
MIFTMVYMASVNGSIRIENPSCSIPIVALSSMPYSNNKITPPIEIVKPNTALRLESL